MRTPLLVQADGSARLLRTEPDLLLGTRAATSRNDRHLHLASGSTLVLYTDGLVERKGEDIDTGLSRLVDAAERAAGLPPDELCDALLQQLGADADDDIALLVLSVL